MVLKTAVKSGSRKIDKVWSDPVSRVGSGRVGDLFTKCSVALVLSEPLWAVSLWCAYDYEI